MIGIDPHKPAWAHPNNPGIPKVCECGREFRDYTKKSKHTLCRACYQIKYFRNTTTRFRPNVITPKKEYMDSRICPHCDGAGCLDCTAGVAELEPEQELKLGRE